MHSWDGPLDYSKNVMSHAVQLEKSLLNFFGNIKSILMQQKYKNGSENILKMEEIKKEHNYNELEANLYKM